MFGGRLLLFVIYLFILPSSDSGDCTAQMHPEAEDPGAVHSQALAEGAWFSACDTPCEGLYGAGKSSQQKCATFPCQTTPEDGRNATPRTGLVVRDVPQDGKEGCQLLPRLWRTLAGCRIATQLCHAAGAGAMARDMAPSETQVSEVEDDSLAAERGQRQRQGRAWRQGQVQSSSTTDGGEAAAQGASAGGSSCSAGRATSQWTQADASREWCVTREDALGKPLEGAVGGIGLPAGSSSADPGGDSTEQHADDDEGLAQGSRRASEGTHSSYKGAEHAGQLSAGLVGVHGQPDQPRGETGPGAGHYPRGTGLGGATMVPSGTSSRPAVGEAYSQRQGSGRGIQGHADFRGPRRGGDRTRGPTTSGLPGEEGSHYEHGASPLGPARFRSRTSARACQRGLTHAQTDCATDRLLQGRAEGAAQGDSRRGGQGCNSRGWRAQGIHALSAWYAAAFAPQVGPFISRQVMCGPPSQLCHRIGEHSICSERHFVGAYAGQFLGIMQCLEVRLWEAALPKHTVWEDPRLPECSLPVPAKYDLVVLRVQDDLSCLACTMARGGARTTEDVAPSHRSPAVHMALPAVVADVEGARRPSPERPPRAIGQDGMRSEAEHSVQAVFRRLCSCLHATPHLLPLKVCFQSDHVRHANRWARQFLQACGRGNRARYYRVELMPSPISEESKAGSTSNLAPHFSQPSVRQLLADRIDVFPESLDRPELREQPLTSFRWYQGYRLSGASSSRVHRDRCALFLTGEHMTIRSLPPGCTINSLIADLISSYPRLKAIRILHNRLEQLPPTQITLVMRTDPPGSQIIPLDFRSLQGQVCTLAVRAGADFREIADQVQGECPDTRLPRGLYRLLEPSRTPLQRIPVGTEAPEFLRAETHELPRARTPDPASPPFEEEPVADATSWLQLHSAVTNEMGVCKVGTQEHAPAANCSSRQPDVITHMPTSGGSSKIQEIFLPDPTHLQIIRVEDLRILPAEFRDDHVFNAPTSRFRWGVADREHFGKYTVFDVQRHVVVVQGLANADLHSVIAQAVAGSPFPVGTVQVLTSPLEGLPRPQLVLHEEGHTFPFAPVPWDLRRVNGAIRTLEHKGEQPLRTAMQQLQATLPGDFDLWMDIVEGLLFVSDAAGPILDALPSNLLQVQYLDVATVPSGPFVLQRISAPILSGSSAAQEGTTRTTTWMQARTAAPVPPILRLVLFRGTAAVSTDLNPPYRLIDRALAHLLAQISAMQPLSAHSSVVLAGAQPPRNGYVQEVIVIVSDSTTSVQVAWDSRPVGGGLQALSYDAATSSTEILPATWTEEGWNLAVNGVPVTSMNRAVRPGDLLQPYHGNQPYPVVPQGFILGLCPQLAVLAWPAWIREGGLPMTTFETLFPRFVELSRSRRVTMGAFYRDAGFAAVLGPVHGTIHLHFPNPVSPTIQEVVDRLTMLDHPPPWADVLKAAVLWPETSLFTTSSQDVAGQTVLIPAPSYAEQHLVIVVPPQSGLVDGLPGEANAQLFPRRSLNSGDVLYLQRDPGRMPEPDTDIEEELAVLLQTRVRRIASTRQASGATIPTPFGRRLLLPDSAGSKGTRMAPGPLDSVDRRICLDRAIPAANSRRLAGRAYMHLGATADAFADVFADFSLACLQSQRPKGDGLPPKIQSFLQSLPLLADRMPQALQIYVDGSFFRT